MPGVAKRPKTVAAVTGDHIAAGGRRWKAHFGNLHAHTALSDGSGAPAEAYRHAKAAGLDFMSITEHNHMTTVADFAQVVAAARAATTPTFAALVGQEFSAIRNGNHINIHGVDEPLPKHRNREYRYVFEQFVPCFVATHPKAVVTLELNHPSLGSVVRDYGIRAKNDTVRNYDDDWTAWVRGADPWVNGVAILNGPSDSNKPANFTYTPNAHRDVNPKDLRRWLTYLDRGLHAAPTAHQDNHMKTWGDRTAARTGVWLSEPLTPTGVLRGLKQRRAFATEDHNLAVWLSVNGEPMGSVVALTPQDARVDVVVLDGDEPRSQYRVELLRGVPHDGERARSTGVVGLVDSGGRWSTIWRHAEDELLLVHVAQVDSEDDAWTAPVWLQASGIDLADPGCPEG